jgi:hypothetical protein
MEEPKTNGAMTGRVQPREFSSTQLKRIATKYLRKGRKATLAKYQLSDPQLYSILHAQGVKLRGKAGVKNATTQPKPRSADPKPGRYRGKGRKSAAPRASYKAAGRHERGGVGDALVYLDKAKERLISRLGGTYEDTGATLGLVCLAIDALIGRE